MAVLVLAEHDLGHLSPATARIVAAAEQLGPVDLLVAGQGVSRRCRRSVGDRRRRPCPRRRHRCLGRAFARGAGGRSRAAQRALHPHRRRLSSDRPRRHPAARGKARPDAGHRHRRHPRPDPLRSPDLRRQRHRDGLVDGQPKQLLTIRASAFRPAATRQRRADRAAAPDGPHGHDVPRRAPHRGRPAGSRHGADRRRRWRQLRLGREVRAGRRPRQDPRRCRRRHPRRRRCRLRPQRLAGRPDRQDRRPRPLYRHRHLRRAAAPRRHPGRQEDHRHQQGPRGAADEDRRRTRWSAICSRSFPR